MGDGGTLTVQLYTDAADNPCGVLCIRDTGLGMDDEVREKLFTPFFTTKEDGTGLGLVTSKKIIEAHSGHIRVESQPGTGTSFFISIPQ